MKSIYVLISLVTINVYEQHQEYLDKVREMEGKPAAVKQTKRKWIKRHPLTWQVLPHRVENYNDPFMAEAIEVIQKAKPPSNEARERAWSFLKRENHPLVIRGWVVHIDKVTGKPGDWVADTLISPAVHGRDGTAGISLFADYHEVYQFHHNKLSLIRTYGCIPKNGPRIISKHPSPYGWNIWP
jgi:hypothetical protein